ncbi:MAG: AmmeMemoRadiSam system protein B [Planctomycetota bacterium]
MDDPSTPPPAEFDPASPHHTQPKLRPVQGFRAEANGQPVLGIRDVQQISERVVFTGAVAQFLLPSMDGDHTVDQIVEEAAGRAQDAGAPEPALQALTVDATQQLIAQLDGAGLLEGPRFDELLAKLRDDFDASDVLPPGPTADFADAIVTHAAKQAGEDEPGEEVKAERSPAALRTQLEAWCNQALEPVTDPSFDALPRAIIAPHSDYQRGWLNYAHAYGRMRVADPPDRIVILGVNHHGRGTGVVGCDKGYRTPLGTCGFDTELDTALREALGPADTERYYAERFDHEREPSVEFQLPWLQHAFGPPELPESTDASAYPKVLAALMYDMTANGAEPTTEAGMPLETFVAALRTAIDRVGGRTLIVAAAELSHVGRGYGDQQSFAGDDDAAKAFRDKVVTHDREMLKAVEEGKPDELLTAFAWNGNWSRWTGLGPLVAAMKLVPGERVKMLNYAAAADNQGVAMISSIAGAIG